MARSYRWEPPIEVVRLGIAEVLLADRPVAVGRVTLTNEVAGTIDGLLERAAAARRLRHQARLGRRTRCVDWRTRAGAADGGADGVGVMPLRASA